MNKFFSIMLLGASFAANANEMCPSSCAQACPPADANCAPCEQPTMTVTEDTVRNVLEHNGQVSFVFSFKCMEGCNSEKCDQICSMVMDCVRACQNTESKNPMKDIMPTISAMCDIVEGEESMRGEMSMIVGMPNPEDCPTDCSSCPSNEACCQEPAVAA